MHSTKPTTAQAIGRSAAQIEVELGVLTNVHNPPKTNHMDEPTVSEALNPERKGKTSPCADEILRSLPEENGHATSHEAGYRACQHEEPTQCLRGWIHGFKHTEAEYENEADKRQRVEADDEKGGPMSC